MARPIRNRNTARRTAREARKRKRIEAMRRLMKKSSGGAGG